MNRNNFLLFTKSSAFIFVGGQKRTHNMGFGVIGAKGRCYLHQQQHSSSCSGRTNIGEHFILSCTSAKHQQRFRADVFQIPPTTPSPNVGCYVATPQLFKVHETE